MARKQLGPTASSGTAVTTKIYVDGAFTDRRVVAANGTWPTPTTITGYTGPRTFDSVAWDTANPTNMMPQPTMATGDVWDRGPR